MAWTAELGPFCCFRIKMLMMFLSRETKPLYVYSQFEAQKSQMSKLPSSLKFRTASFFKLFNLKVREWIKKFVNMIDVRKIAV
mmetsp:Transcript_16709/g.24493  ORF Transcript_16709/g.24493 Transcript_16709/m.24493 type:complete len:83 (-) Transcript_16709:12-260(-)